MPDFNKTLIAVVLDRSGSMAHLREATLGGLNSFLEEQKKLPGDVTAHIVQFDDRYEYMRTYQDLKEMNSLQFSEYRPDLGNGTALLDAVARTIGEVGGHLAGTEEHRRPGKVIFVIQTDGCENQSVEFSAWNGGYQKVADKIKHQREKYSWEFVFLGANQDAIAAAAQVGIGASSALSYGGTVLGTAAAFNATSKSVGLYRSGGSAQAVFNQTDRVAATGGVDPSLLGLDLDAVDKDTDTK